MAPHLSPTLPPSSETANPIPDFSFLGATRLTEIYKANQDQYEAARNPGRLVFVSDFQVHREPRRLSIVDTALLDGLIDVSKWASGDVLHTPLVVAEGF